MGIGQQVELALAIVSGILGLVACAAIFFSTRKADALVMATLLGAAGLVVCDVVWVMRLV